MGEIRFRAAVEADLPAIVELLVADPLGVTREGPAEPLDPAYSKAFEALSADPNQLLAVAESDGGVIGCLQISFIPGITHRGMWRGQIEGVRIAEDRRGGGFGREMIEWAMERCRERGCGLVQLTTDKRRPEAHRFYESLGFTASHAGMKREL